MLVGAVVLGAAIWTGTRGTPPYRPGAVVDMSITLVAADERDLACALPDPIGAAHCAYSEPDKPWREAAHHAESSESLLAPYQTTEGGAVILGDVFSQPDVARRAARDGALARPAQKRFVADCTVRLVERRPSVAVRFGKNAAWGVFDQPWIGIAETCRVRD